MRLPQSPLMTACLIGYARGEASVREVLERHFFWQQPMREIAEELGVSVGFVRDHVRKFREAAGKVGGRVGGQVGGQMANSKWQMADRDGETG